MNRIPWGPIRSSLTANFSFGDIKQIVGYADIDMSLLSRLEQKSQGGASKSQLLSAIDKQIGQMDVNQSGVVASICCEEMLRRRPGLIDELERVLSRVGRAKSNGLRESLRIIIPTKYSLKNSKGRRSR